MGGVMFSGAISIGLLLIAGQQWFADNVVMWFASAGPSLELWRQAIVVSLIVLVIVREYFDNLYLRGMWLLISTALLAAGASYFIDNPAFIFDAMLMLAASSCFALAAIQPGDDDTEENLRLLGWHVRSALRNEIMMPRAVMANLVQRFVPYDRLPPVHYLTHLKDDSHRLSLHGS